MQQTINEQIVNKLNQTGLTISTCESMTGGAIGANLVLVEHASKCYLGSLTTYSPTAKTKLAKVKQETIDENQIVSIQVAREMALGCQRQFNSDICISITGKANPNGMAYVAIALFDQIYDFKFESKYDNRIDTINQCVAFCLNQLWDLIKDLKK